MPSLRKKPMKTLLRSLSVSAAAITLTAGLGAGMASAAPAQGEQKAALGSILSCKKYDYPWC